MTRELCERELEAGMKEMGDMRGTGIVDAGQRSREMREMIDRDERGRREREMRQRGG